MTSQILTAKFTGHPFAADAAGWGLAEDNLAVIEAEGASLVLLLGSFGAAGPLTAGHIPALLASFQLDASGLPGIGARGLFAGQLRLVFRGAEVTEAEALRLEWRSPTTLFTEIPFSLGATGRPVYDAVAARVARITAAWAMSPAARPTLAAAARTGVRGAVQAAAVARDAASRNARAARSRDASPTARAHHIWWAAKREEEAERQLGMATHLRGLQAELLGLARDGEPAARRA